MNRYAAAATLKKPGYHHKPLILALFAIRKSYATLIWTLMDLRLKPQDIVVALKLVARGADEWTQPELARSLHLSASEVNHGLKRLAACHPVQRARPAA